MPIIIIGKGQTQKEGLSMHILSSPQGSSQQRRVTQSHMELVQYFTFSSDVHSSHLHIWKKMQMCAFTSLQWG